MDFWGADGKKAVILSDREQWRGHSSAEKKQGMSPRRQHLRSLLGNEETRWTIANFLLKVKQLTSPSYNFMVITLLTCCIIRTANHRQSTKVISKHSREGQVIDYDRETQNDRVRERGRQRLHNGGTCIFNCWVIAVKKIKWKRLNHSFYWSSSLSATA